jgi:hypothetical protein
VRLDLLRIALGPIGSSRVLEVSPHFLLFRIDRDGRFVTPFAGRNTAGDMAKLPVSISMLRPLARLANALQAVAHRLQHLPYRCDDHGVSLLAQFAS